eukprot:TRINITY_DN21676_c0_g1_i1.p1 TRINITY_DN21676_c0_g1~~TRINITY_DN21676_c0_g1_i1.p1  ORF type:complete len:138 (+),score=36.04 TRINITY_DN21676_c0_g1_i1:120-533(+)
MQRGLVGSEMCIRDRLRAALGATSQIKPVAPAQCLALGAVVEEFVKDMGKALNEEMKTNNKRVVTLDVLASLVERHPLSSFVTGLEQYQTIVEELVQEEDEVKEKRRTERLASSKKSARSKSPSRSRSKSREKAPPS